MLRTIAERLAKDTTLVLVTHKLQLVNLVQRVMVVANGEIAIDGPTQEVLQRLQRPQPQPPAAPRSRSRQRHPTRSLRPQARPVRKEPKREIPGTIQEPLAEPVDSPHLWHSCVPGPGPHLVGVG
ncbi:MAG: hypothetical protein IPK97_18115 [Ahniella sp.]|nr:hypothetical protein [Ahniella sp.]